MIEWLKHIIEELNNYAGLLSLLAVIAAIVVPWIIYRKTAKSHKQEMINEYKARKGQQRFHLPHEMRESYIREETLRRNIEKT
jgi:hypothetical protein